jgi:hypothetical protein
MTAVWLTVLCDLEMRNTTMLMSSSAMESTTDPRKRMKYR